MVNDRLWLMEADQPPMNNEPIKIPGKGRNPKSLANLKPVQKGEKGRNPNGRPRVKHITDAVRDALAEQVRIGMGDKFNMVATIDLLVRAQVKNAAKGDVKAFRELMDRGYGKAKDTIELSGPDGGPMAIVSSSDQDIINRYLAKIKE